MIKDKIKLTKYWRQKVTRICDECGKIEVTSAVTVLMGRESRNSQTDYCKKCSYKYRNLIQKRGKDSPYWKGGRSLTKNGYWRLSDGRYEHKVIASAAIGRELSSMEKVHHIDLNKTNNAIENLHVFSSKSTHSQCHFSLECCARTLIGNKVWFNERTKIYQFEPTESFLIIPTIDDLLAMPRYIQVDHNGRHYEYCYLGNKKHRRLHVLIMERIIGRGLRKGEHVHHIDTNTLNNDPRNLSLLTRSEHKIAHSSLEHIGQRLFMDGLIKFDRRTGKYHCITPSARYKSERRKHERTSPSDCRIANQGEDHQ